MDYSSFTFTRSIYSLNKKRKHVKTEKPEPLCLIISPSEDRSVYYYSAPSRLITPEVVSAVGKGGHGILFMKEAARNKHLGEVADLPACLQVLLGKIKSVEFKNEDSEEEDEDEMFEKGSEQWGGAYGQGPWDGFLAIYQWK